VGVLDGGEDPPALKSRVFPFNAECPPGRSASRRFTKQGQFSAGPERLAEWPLTTRITISCALIARCAVRPQWRLASRIISGSIAELMQAALEPSDTPPIPRTSTTTLRPGTRQFRLIVGRGGKGTNKPR
jgi:hypothetical protein